MLPLNRKLNGFFTLVYRLKNFDFYLNIKCFTNSGNDTDVDVNFKCES